MIKERIKAVLHYVFIMAPFSFIHGLGIILICDERICDTVFSTKKIRAKKKEIDKKKFDKFMKRVTR